MKRDYSEIDPKIQPLVDALNGIAGVQTIASCEGHFSRISRPYVYFHCPPALAERFAVRLHNLYMADTLHRWWHLTGCFNMEHQLCFCLEAPGLDHDRGLFKTFVNYVIFRKRIDADLGVLSKVLNNSLNDAVDDRREDPGQIGDGEPEANDKSNADTSSGVIALQAGHFAERVFGFAVGTRTVNVRRNLDVAETARNQLSHDASFPYLKPAWTLARSFVVVAFLAVTLTACGSSREIQKDGSGTDEMLKSPCACVPVPYDAPGYEWVS